jgi:hypothetical protein
MSQFFYIHPDNPQPRLINQAVEIVRKGGYCLPDRFWLRAGLQN